ncbi:M50 family metallopeptidase [Legionella sp. CNM-4043-24]|uniref:M50 family metallopeptidase n=1 Tax=Legionella sp. CNM-4043-24 TaxID=3421646 RepID=UPI00403A8857
MTIFLPLMAFVLTLLLVVGLHEAGHAIAARICGVRIERISIGFGRPLLSRRDRSGCEWVWALWPLGGYVQLLNTRIHPVDPSDYPFCFDKKSMSVRCLILISGIVANVLVAWLALVLFFWMGYQQMTPVISEVRPGTLMAQAGVRAGDELVSLEGQKTDSWQQAGMELIRNFGKKQVVLELRSPDHSLRFVTVDLSERFSARGRTLMSYLGLVPDQALQHIYAVKGLSFLNALAEASRKTGDAFVFFMIVLKQLFTGTIPFALLLGPVGFIGLSISSFAQGVAVFLSYIANLSLAVALINLLPVPGLDGASIVYAVIEKIRGKAMSIAFEVLLYRLAVILFYMILVQLLLNDFLRYAQGS